MGYLTTEIVKLTGVTITEEQERAMELTANVLGYSSSSLLYKMQNMKPDFRRQALLSTRTDQLPGVSCFYKGMIGGLVALFMVWIVRKSYNA